MGGQVLQQVHIPVDATRLEGDLTLPVDATGIVLFAHGSGSGRLSSRNKFVAGMLYEAKVATLLFDMLTSHEQELDMRSGHLRFDIDFLARRLLEATHWVHEQQETREMNIGYFGGSTGAAAALVAAAQEPDKVHAIVSRGGRPDLAAAWLPKVKAPTLLIVGGADYTVVELNRKAREELTAKRKLAIVPGATHLFEEPGALDQVAELASKWFLEHMTGNRGEHV